ncbi:DNA-binding protein [Undibacterium sp.]|jgi:chromosome segregation ATPase|uniref:DNA-binding protein n=1 Tax=Undibacterium sp. TaxID=1914977 RepID=UPI002C74A779|nr:DNA-binding protein [Undibacterium sp.]HTD06226.1 DNA-binding protein [Undibacterium sp.]
MENLINEKQLASEIEQLRVQFTNTQDLYREVCALLFFRHGVTPTANKLYQLVRKGSMSAPAEALNKFWGDLREKSRVRIEHPDLPEALKVATADLAVALWSTAQEQAQSSLSGYRLEFQEAVSAAGAAKDAAENGQRIARQALEEMQVHMAAAKVTIQNLQHQLTASTAVKDSLESQLASAKNEVGAYQARLTDAAQEFTHELEKQRQASQLADERFRAAENRALLEVDRERMQSAKSQKELAQSRLSALEASDQHQSEMRELQSQIGECRQQLGSLQGSLRVVTESRDFALQELSAERSKLHEAQLLLAATNAESESRLRQIREAQRSIEDLSAAVKPGRMPRKNKSAQS